jgi:type IV secretory pathway protease TraF
MVGLRFVPNLTESLPEDAFLLVAVGGIAPKGYVVAIDHDVPDTIGREDRRVIKRVVATAGAEVRCDEHVVCAGGVCLPVAEAARKLGLSPLNATVVPEGHVAVMGTHPLSYDTRYAEFGFVSLDKITAVGWGLDLPDDGWFPDLVFALSGSSWGDAQ